MPRNVRLGLLGIDVVQPYTCYTSVKAMLIPIQMISQHHHRHRHLRHIHSNNTTIKDDFHNDHNDITYKHNSSTTTISTTIPNNHILNKRKLKLSAKNKNQLRKVFSLNTTWYVGGSFHVDATFLTLHSALPDFTDGTRDWTKYINLLQPPIDNTAATTSAAENSDMETITLPYNITNIMSGPGIWGGVDISRLKPYKYSSQLHFAINTASNYSFTTKLKLKIFKELKDQKVHFLIPGIYWIVGWSVSDQKWGQLNQGEPKIPPQSMLVNARFNTSFSMNSPNKKNEKKSSTNTRKAKVQGRKYFPSDPIILSVDHTGIHILSATLNCAWWHNDQLNIQRQTTVSNSTTFLFPSTNTEIFINYIDESNYTFITTNISTNTNSSTNNTYINHIVEKALDESNMDSIVINTMDTSNQSSYRLIFVTIMMFLIASIILLFQFIKRYQLNRKRNIKVIKPNPNPNPNRILSNDNFGSSNQWLLTSENEF